MHVSLKIRRSLHSTCNYCSQVQLNDALLTLNFDKQQAEDFQAKQNKMTEFDKQSKAKQVEI